MTLKLHPGEIQRVWLCDPLPELLRVDVNLHKGDVYLFDGGEVDVCQDEDPGSGTAGSQPLH